MTNMTDSFVFRSQVDLKYERALKMRLYENKSDATDKCFIVDCRERNNMGVTDVTLRISLTQFARFLQIQKVETLAIYGLLGATMSFPFSGVLNFLFKSIET